LASGPGSDVGVGLEAGVAEADGDAMGVGSSVGVTDTDAPGEVHPATRETRNAAATAVVVFMPSQPRAQTRHSHLERQIRCYSPGTLPRADRELVRIDPRMSHDVASNPLQSSVVDDRFASRNEFGEAVAHLLNLLGRVADPIRNLPYDTDGFASAVRPAGVSGELRVRQIGVVL